MSWLYLLVLICPQCLVFGIHCLSQQGTISGPNLGDVSQAQCPTLYSIVSCGFQTIDENAWESFDGSYIIGDTCFARNGNNSSPAGVQAVARCCQLSQISTFCTTFQSNRSNASDDYATSFTCPTTQPLLMGCGVSTDGPWPSIDGAYPLPEYEFYWKSPNIFYPTNNTCTGKNGSGGKGVYAWATCCNTTDSTVNLQCKMMIGEDSPSLTGSNTNNTGQESIVTCPSNYFMTSCHAFSFYKSQNKWIIDDNDRCIGRAVDLWGDHYNTTASAICCQVDTIAPSTTPSAMPSHTPSNMPTSYTSNPSDSPTSNPIIPSISPTSSPLMPSLASLFPTEMPSNIQTIDDSDVDLRKDGIFISFDSPWLIYVVIGLSVFLCCCIFIIIWCFCNHKKQNKLKIETMKANGGGIQSITYNTDNDDIVQPGSPNTNHVKYNSTSFIVSGSMELTKQAINSAVANEMVIPDLPNENMENNDAREGGLISKPNGSTPKTTMGYDIIVTQGNIENKSVKNYHSDAHSEDSNYDDDKLYQNNYAAKKRKKDSDDIYQDYGNPTKTTTSY